VTENLTDGLGPLLLRVGLGIVFLAHGLDKLGDVAAVEANFESLGIPAPALMAPFVTAVEVVGGALLILGLLTPLAGVALAGDMLVAALTAHTDKGFFVADGGYELVMMLGLASLAAAAIGPGRFSADALLRLRLPVLGRIAPLRTSDSRH